MSVCKKEWNELKIESESKMLKYALYSKSKNQFKFIDDSLLMLNARINKAFQNRSGMAAKGSKYTFEDFIEDFERVEVKITPIESEMKNDNQDKK